MGLFPDNMFKTIHVNSKIAHRQIRSTPHEFIKKTKSVKKTDDPKNLIIFGLPKVALVR